MTELRISEFESAPDAFPVKLSNFEGPLDLLLHLIRKHEVDIHDIPIALITAQYLQAIALMQELDLDVAGEFLVMAATLIHIKSKMLLPRPETAAGVEGEVEDPRDALVRRLLEHQKFKAAAGLLHEREQLRAAQWLRPDGRVAELAGRRVRAGARGRSVQPDERVSGGRRSRSSSGRRWCCRRGDAGGAAHRAAARAPLRNRGDAASTSCSPTSITAAA